MPFFSFSYSQWLRGGGLDGLDAALGAAAAGGDPRPRRGGAEAQPAPVRAFTPRTAPVFAMLPQYFSKFSRCTPVFFAILVILHTCIFREARCASEREHSE